VAHILLGSLMNYVLLEQISSQAIIERVNLPIGTYLNSEVRATEVSTFIQSFVDIVWQGIAPMRD
jgi:hypothetical protein